MNDENLKNGEATRFRSGEEAAKNGRKGGRASGAVRGFKAALKKKIRDNPKLTEEFINTLLEMFLEDRNIKAAELLAELFDEKTSELDKKLKKAQIEKIKAETEEIRRRNDDGSAADEEKCNNTIDDWVNSIPDTPSEEDDSSGNESTN